LFPGKSMMTMSTGPNPINPPLIGPSQNPNKVIQGFETLGEIEIQKWALTGSNRRPTD
jgi:hypothetical protein